MTENMKKKEKIKEQSKMTALLLLHRERKFYLIIYIMTEKIKEISKINKFHS